MIGEMFMLLGDFAKSLKHEQIYLECSKSARNEIEEQRAYATIGRVHLLHGQSLTDIKETTPHLRKAEKAFLKSLLVCKGLRGLSKLEIVDMEARLYLNLSVVKENLEDFDDSIQFMEKALTLCRKNELFELLHQCYVTAALFYHMRQNDNTKALRFLNLALEVAERLAEKVLKMVETLIVKSDIFIKTGDFQSAKQVLRKAYKLKSSNKEDRETVEKRLRVVAAMCYTEDALLALDSDDFVTKKNLYEKMGDGACALQNYSKAIDYYLKMLEMAEQGHFDSKELVPVYVSLYQTYTDLKQYDEALIYLRKEQEINKDDPKEAITTLIHIADVFDLSGKGFWEVENVYQEARTEAQKLHDLKLEKRIGMKQIALRKKHKMSTLLEILVDELKMSGIDVNLNEVDEEYSDDVEPSSQESEFEKNTPDIGEDICLSDISGSDSEDKANTSGLRARKKRGQSFAIKRNEKGETQLHQACISGNLQQVVRLIDQGHPVNIRDHAGWTPLHEASNHGYHDIVSVLLERGAAINDKGGKSCDGITALHDACVNGCLEVVEVLLDHGAQPTLRTDFNDTALDSLEKWKATAQLDTNEQIFYEVIKERIMKMLKTAGCVDGNVSSPKDSSLNRSGGKLPSPVKRRSKIGTLRNAAFLYSDSDDDNECANVPETVDDIMNKEFPPTETDASEEYRSAIENVRKAQKLSLAAPTLNFESKRKTGLLSHDEVGESWLEEDIPSKKKRKLTSMTHTYSHNDMSNSSPAKTSSKARNSYDNLYRSKENVAADLFDDVPVQTYSIHDDDSLDAFDVLMSKSGTSSAPKRRRRISSSDSRNRTNIAGRQATLLSNGFTKINQPSSSFLEGSGAFSPVKASPKKSSPVATKMASIKVKVEDHSLNVPVTNVEDLTVGWLAEEAARRYYNLKGLRPVLRLMTEDGAIFENDDPISVTFGEVIYSTVLDWKLPHISQRYMEVCQQLKTEPLDYVQSTLELIQATQELKITDQLLDKQKSEPIFKSLQHQTSLETIDLSNNFLEDEILKLLATILPTLPRLKNLHLAGNYITRDGITNLASAKEFPDLESLDLSFNPLTNQSIPSLNVLLTKAKNLKKLSLSSTEMTDIPDPPTEFKYSQVTDIDFSFNQIKLPNLKKVLRKLNSCRLVSLNLAFSCTERGVMEPIAAFLNAGTCEKLRDINLTGLDLEDSDIWSLLQALERAKNLNELRLMENKRLTSMSLKFLLEQLSVKYLVLDGCWRLFGKSGDNIYVSECSIGQIRMTVDPVSRTNDLEWITETWRRIFGDRANTTVRHNCVTLTVSDSSKLPMVKTETYNSLLKTTTFTPSNDTYLLAELIPILRPLNNYMFDGPAHISQAPTSTKTTTPTLDEMMYYNYYAASMYCQYYLNDLSCVFCDKFRADVDAYAALVAISHNRKEVVVTYRGSSNIWNIVLDDIFINIDYGNATDNIKLHRGCYYATMSLYNKGSVVHHVSYLRRLYPDYKLVLSGHSLGGNMARITLFLLLYLNQYPGCRYEIYTYGDPRVGNKEFVDFMNKQTLVSSRVVASIVGTTILMDNYLHTQTEFWINGFDDQRFCNRTIYEDPNCSNSMGPAYNVLDHLVYFDVNYGLCWTQGAQLLALPASIFQPVGTIPPLPQKITKYLDVVADFIGQPWVKLKQNNSVPINSNNNKQFIASNLTPH
ncbi:Tonsoku-like protein, partial [Pseudolycoriella hygida]